MCDCFARVFGVSWSPAASSAAEGHVPDSHVSRARQQVPPVESKRNDQPAQGQTSAGPHSPLHPEDAGDPDRAAQKEKLHAELKRVLQEKGARQASSEEEAEVVAAVASQPPGAGETRLSEMEKMPAMPEPLEVIVETEAEAGVSGMSVAGGGKQGLFVKDVQKGSPAARTLSLREGDQILSARVYFENMKYEDALQILKSAEPYKVSFCLKRTVPPSTDGTRSPGAPPLEGRGPKAKMAKLSVQTLASLKKKAGKGGAQDHRGSRELEVAPVDVEFSLPKFPKLRKARSAGEVAAAQPSPDLSPLLSSLETKRRRLKLPRLRVKEALAARAAGRLDGAPPKAAPAQKAAAREGAGGKASRFTIPFSKGKKPKEEVAAVGFQAPQVELDFPMPKAGPGRESPKAGVDREGVTFGLPEVEVVLPKGSPAGPGAPGEGSHLAGLRLPRAEVAAPQVDVSLSLPGLEGTPPEVALRGEGFRIKVPKVGVSAEEGEKKPALLDVVIGKGRGQAEGPEEKGARPSLEVGLPSVDIELPLPRGKVEAEVPKPKMEIPEVSIKVPTVSLPKLGSKPQEEEREEDSRVPQVELSVGKRESPKAKAEGGQAPGLGVSLTTERKSEGAEATESKTRSLKGLKMPSLDISAPRVSDMQLPKALAGLAASAPEAATEEPRFKMPQVSLPKCSLPDKATPSPPQAPRKPEGKAGGKAGVPALDLSLPEVPLPRGHVPKPELDLCVDRPRLEVVLPATRLSFPSAAAPALELDLPTPAVELGLPKVDRERLGSDHPSRDHEVKPKMPALETLSKDLSLEISVPKCREEQPGVEASEGPGVGVIVARLPKVDLAIGGEEAAEPGVAHKGKLPSVELATGATERGRSPERDAKLKSPKFALPKFSLSGPKAWKLGTPEETGPEGADRGARLKMPKFGISFPKARAGAEAEGPKPSPERSSPPGKEQAEARGMKLPSVALPKMGVEVPIGEEGPSTLPELALEPPDLRRKMPKFSLPKFGGRGKEGDVEMETGEALGGERGAKAEGEAQAKASKFKAVLFGMAGRDLPEGEAGSPLLRMPKLKLPSPKAELGQGHIPQVELPKLSFPEGARAEEALLGGSESPSLRAKVPALEIAMPGAAAKAETTPGRPRAETPRRQEAELRVPQAPSLGISAPQVELELGLPTIGAEGVPGTEAKAKLPQVELPTFGRGEAAEMPLPSRGRGEQGTAIRVPSMDLSLPTGHLPEGQGDGEAAVGRIQVPSVELPTFPTPKVTASEREGSPEGGRILPTITLSGPAVRLPAFRGPSGEGEGEARLPQLELKVPTLGGSAEMPDTEGRACPPSSFGLCQAGGGAEAADEVAAVGPDSKFKLKMPSLSISKAGPPEPRADTQPLCPPSPWKEGDASFKMPPITLPEVGFSVGPEARAGAGELASAEGLEGEGLKMPKMKIPAVGVSVPKGGWGAAAAPQDPEEGKKAAFRVPGLELAAPTLKGHGEYEVGGGPASKEGRESPRGGGEAPEAGWKYKVKIPKFGLSLPKAGEGAPPGQEGEAKGKRPAFALGRPRGRGAEGSPGLLEGEEEAAEGRGVLDRFRLGLARMKMGSPEANGEVEHNGASRVKLPKLGFSSGEGAEEEALQNGAQDNGKGGKLGKIRLPQVELSSPSPAAEGDPELSLKLVRAEEAPEGGGAFGALKLKPPKITFSGFKKRNGEPGPGALVSSAARTEMASLERGDAAPKGERSPRFRFPKVALSPKAQGGLEITPKASQAGGGAESPVAQGGLL